MSHLNDSTSQIAMVSALGGRMNPVERAQGRFLRSDAGHRTDSGGGDQSGGGMGGAPANNPGDNQQTGAASGDSNNNTGQQFDPKSFWDDPAPAPAKQAESGPSAGTSSGAGSTENQTPADINTVIGNHIKEFSPPEVMTSDALKGIGEGKYEDFNKNLNTALQNSMEHSMGMTVRIITAFGQKMMEQIDSKIQGSNQQREDLTALHEAIPSSKDDTVFPMVKPIYDRALKLTNGDRTKAANMTKQMLAHMASGTAGDTGLTVAPRSSDSDLPPPGAGGSTNWIEELMAPQR